MVPSPNGPGAGPPLTEPSVRPRSGDEIVISGISGIFPKSEYITEFSKNLFEKVDMVSKDEMKFRHPEAPTHLGKLEGVQNFDAQFFGITYSLAYNLDPMCKKLWEQSYMAMFDAGINPLSLRGKKVGVFMGTSYSDMSNVTMYYSLDQKQSGYCLMGCAKSMFANRISYWANLTGPSMAFDNACASSMVCLEEAYKSMVNGECEAAVVGAANLCLEPHLNLNLKKSGFLSSDGKTRCFDKNGDGPVRAEAVSCFFLQKAKDAKRIYAELYYINSGYGLRTDARFFPLRPVDDIEEFLREFYSKIDIKPEEIEYVEAHGAAFAEADTNELEAIGRIFANTDRPLKVGCVKSNMGNSDPASGACAFTKVCLAYHEGKLPANLHYSDPLDVPALKEGKLKVVEETENFSRGLTAVNQFSVNGMNYHALLKGHFKPKPDSMKYKTDIPRLILISGRQEKSIEKVISILKSKPLDPEIIGMLHNIYRIDTPGHIARGYTVLDTNDKKETISLSESAVYYPGLKRPLWLVFSGMGSQWPGMAVELMKIPVFASAIKKCHKALEPYGVNLIKVLTESDKAVFDDIVNCFIGISAVQIGLTDVLKTIGLVPDYVIGHSQGEMGCAYFDDCFTTEEMILAAYSRGLVSSTSTFIKGGMAAVGLGYKDILPLCPPEIDVACHNSDESATISGPAEVLKEFVAELTAKKIFAREVPSANIAFHSRYIAVAGPTFLEKMNEIIKEPKLRSEKWICTSVPQERWDEPLAKYSSAEYHTNNLLSPVYFEEAARLIPSNAVVVEVAPHCLLQSILKKSHPDCIHIPLTRRGQTDQIKFLFDGIGKIYEEGFEFDLQGLYPPIEYPVSTETDHISHYVDWEHSEPWPMIVKCHAKDFTEVTTKCREIFISVHDEEYSYMSGHIRNGNTILPEAAILFMVWETLAMFLGIKHTDLSVVFNDVHFHGEAILEVEEVSKINISIHKGNDSFEVTHNSNVLVSGTVAQSIKPKFEVLKDKYELNEDDLFYQTEDIYRELHSKGLTYRGALQSIHSTNKRNKAYVTWRNDWVTFLDSLIQFNILAKDSEYATLPKIIKSITINMEDQKKESQIIINNEACYVATLYDVYGVTRCGGVEIRNIIFEDKPPNEKEPDFLGSLTFTPHIITGEVSMELALQVQLQIVAENVPEETITITEVLGASPALSNIIEKIATSIPNVLIKTHQVGVNNFHETNNSNIIILQDFMDNGRKINDVLEMIDKNNFLLVYGHSFGKNDHFNVLSMMIVGKKELTLLKKNDPKYYENTTCIKIENDTKFTWVSQVKSELQKTKHVVLVSERQPHCGLLGVVKKLRKTNQNLSVVILDDYHAPSFDKNGSVFREQLQKKLAVNVYLKGQWGGYYYLQRSNPIDVQNFKLITNVMGDLNGLKWAEIPKVGVSNNSVQVCYAGPTIRDSERAVGLTDNSENGFGMDFSGFDVNGERVMGLLPVGAIASTVQADTDFLWPVPDHWTLEEAATVPLPYVHALYILVIKCTLQRGQTVFVSGGAGALGQAVISVCLAHDCKVFTSVSEISKKQLLLKIFPQLEDSNIGYSRKGAFKNDVLLQTKGKRCHFVINCASGESREAAMKCVGETGILIDVSDYDIKKNEGFGMAFVSGERNYMSANLSSIFKTENIEEKKLLQLIMAQGISNGTIKPLTRVVYSTTHVSKAFRLLTSNKHRGRVLLKVKDANTPVKTLGVIPIQTYASNESYIIVCDDSDLGIELANHLLKKGARNLVLHRRSKSVSGYEHSKIESWMKQGAKIKISTERLDSDKGCVQLLQESEKIGRVQGIFIIQDSVPDKSRWSQEDFVDKYQNMVTVVANMDVLSRNNCPELRYFVVISRAAQNIVEDYAISVADKICQGRSAVAMPGLSFKIEYLDELQTKYKYNDRLRPQPFVTVLNAMERSLKQKQSSALCYSVKTNTSVVSDYIDSICSILGIKDINKIDENLLLNDYVTNDVNVEELRILIKDKFKIDYSPEVLKSMSIRRLKDLAITKTRQRTKFDSGLEAIYSFVEKDEYLASETTISMQTPLVNEATNIGELDENAPHLMLIPGFDGHHSIFNSICQRIKIRAMAFPLGPEDMGTKSISDMAQSVFTHIKKNLHFNSKFYLLGYSFGVNVALEIASLLEREGHTGVVICLDSSPDILKQQLDAYIGKNNLIELQNAIIEHFFYLMAGRNDNELRSTILKMEEWNDKVEVFVKKLKLYATYSSVYSKNVIDTAVSRILLVKSYEPQMSLKSEIVLIKGIPHPKLNSLSEDYGLSKYSKQPVKIFDIASDFAAAPQDGRISNIVNKLIDPKDLEEYKNRNHCATYYV